MVPSRVESTFPWHSKQGRISESRDYGLDDSTQQASSDLDCSTFDPQPPPSSHSTASRHPLQDLSAASLVSNVDENFDCDEYVDQMHDRFRQINAAGDGGRRLTRSSFSTPSTRIDNTANSLTPHLAGRQHLVLVLIQI